MIICIRSPTAGSKDSYDMFYVAAQSSAKGVSRGSDAVTPPVITPRLSPESGTPPRNVFSDGLLARLSQDPNLARFLKSSSQDQPARNGQQQAPFARRISTEGLPVRR